MSKPGFKRSHKNRKYMGQKYDNFFERRKEFKESAQPPSPIKKPSSRKYSRDSDNYSTSNEDNQPIPFKSKAEDFKTKYKTELCKYFEINGYCKYGENCAYAHGKENLRSKVTNSTAYRTKKCIQFFENGFCPYGNRCQFAHALKSNILNNPYEKDMSYFKVMKTLSKLENVENIRTFKDKKRLPVFEEIVSEDFEDRGCGLFEDIKKLTQNDLFVRM